MANVLKARAGQLQVAEPVLSSAFDIGMEPRGLVAEAMARIFLSTYRMTDASRALDRWMEADPNDARPYLWRNEIDERMGAEPPELIRNYRTALKLDPNLDKARLGLAEILLKFHRNDEAEVEFAAYIARNPESNAGHIGLGQIAVLRGDLTTATREFVDVLKRDPKNLSALQELALIEMRSNKAEAAAARLKKAIDIAPYDVGLHYDYARALKLSGNEAKAAEETATTNRLRKESEQITKMRNELVNRPDDDELKADVVGWLIEHGQEQEALKWSELILARKPTHSKTCAILTKYYERIGNAGLANYYRTFAGNGAK
jgi:predicted Zn-dependent protease